MFGYVKPYSPELRVRENECYRALYCGLCRSLKHCTGQVSRLTLNYDFVFAALLRIAASDNAPKYKARRCVVHPLTKRPCAERTPELDFCARVSVLLSYHKADDDARDEKRAKRLQAKLLRQLLKGMRRRVKKQLREADDIIADGLTKLTEIEDQGLPSVDLPADCFGELMGRLVSLDCEATQCRILYAAGFHLGRWLYIIDAADDFESDREKGRFNPFLLLYNRDKLDEAKRSDILNALTAELIELEAALDLLTQDAGQGEIFSIIDNILHLGMPHTAHMVLECNGKERKDDRSL